MYFSRSRTMILTAVLAVACFSAPVGSDSTRSGDCTSTREYFLSRNIGLSHIVPDNPTYDPNMEVCYNGVKNPTKTSCCTHQMEKRYAIAAKKTFKETLKTTNLAYLTRIFETHTKQYQDYFHGLVSIAENKTISLFTEVYGIKHWGRLEPLLGIYKDLNKYIDNKQDVNLIESVDKFFDQLFPAIFHKIMNDPANVDYSVGYKNCLTSERQKLSPSPFGDYPGNIALLLTRSFSTARTLLDTLKLGIDVMNATEHFSPDSSCARSLTRLQYCSHCDGVIFIKPCMGFCRNVMRGCLARIQDLDMDWNRMLEQVAQLTAKMKGSYSVEDSLKKLDSKISEAMLHAIDIGPRFYSQAISRCGHPKVEPLSGHSSNPHPSADHSVGLAGTDTTDLHKRFELFTNTELLSKRFFHNLADVVCSQENYYDISDNLHCWNGESVAPYTKKVTPVNLNEQLANNPEVDVSSRNAAITRLGQRLQENNKQLEHKVAAEPAQSDQPYWSSQVYDPYLAEDLPKGLGSGSGPSYQDDEDFSDESGSGSGMRPYNPRHPPKGNEEFFDTTTRDKDAELVGDTGKSKSQGENGATSLHRTVLALIPPLLVALFNG